MLVRKSAAGCSCRESGSAAVEPVHAALVHCSMCGGITKDDKEVKVVTREKGAGAPANGTTCPQVYIQFRN